MPAQAVPAAHSGDAADGLAGLLDWRRLDGPRAVQFETDGYLETLRIFMFGVLMTG